MEAQHRWTAGTALAVHSALTWNQWRSYQAGRLELTKRRQESGQLSERELARLSFIRWLYQTGRLGPTNDGAS